MWAHIAVRITMGWAMSQRLKAEYPTSTPSWGSRLLKAALCSGKVSLATREATRIENTCPAKMKKTCRYQMAVKERRGYGLVPAVPKRFHPHPKGSESTGRSFCPSLKKCMVLWARW